MGVFSEKQTEIYWLYFEEDLSQKQIAQRLGITQQAVSKNIIKIKQLRPGCEKRDMVNIKSSKFWRYHALHFVVTPYYFYPRYAKIRAGRGDYFLNHREWKIKLYEKKVELRLRKGFDFLDEDKFEAMQKAEDSLNRTLFEISNKYGFEYKKEGRIAIKLCKQHLAKTNSPLAKARKGQYMQIRGVDGKVWFLIDKSKGILEHEYVHSKRLLSDSDAVEPFLNDLLQHPGLTLSGVYQVQEKGNLLLQGFSVQLKRHLDAINRIGSGMDRWGIAIEGMISMLEKLEKKL